MRYIKYFFRDFLLYAAYGIMAWFIVAFIFGRIEYQPASKRVMVCFDATVEQRKLSVELEKNMPEGIKQVRAYALDYFMMDDGMISAGDIYILQKEYAETVEYEFEGISPDMFKGDFEFLTANNRIIGILVKRKGQPGVADAFVDYRDADYYLCFKAGSGHIKTITGTGDDAAMSVFYDLIKLK